MGIPFFFSKRTVLLVSDEALYIFKAGGGKASFVESVEWEVENFADHVSNIIVRRCGRAPVLIINDMVEQYYRKEKVLQSGVGILDRATMLKRKLNVAFPNYKIRAALPLKEKLRADAGKSKLYIFAALQENNEFTQTMRAAQRSMVNLTGMGLLPIESADMVKALAQKLSRGARDKAQWVVFMGQHQNGSLRQIITKKGELALTRMTPITENDDDASVWAGEVHQEFKATMSYLSRFGYKPEDGLDVIAITSPMAGDALQIVMEAELCNLKTLTAPDAARLLGLSLDRKDEPRYADRLHVAWIGRKSRLTLPMKAVEIERVSAPRHVAALASVCLLLGSAYLAYDAVNQWSEIQEINDDIDIKYRQKSQAESQYQIQVQRKEALGFDVRLVQASARVHNYFEKQRVEPLPLFREIGYALGRDLRLDRITIMPPREQKIRNPLAQNEEQGRPQFEALMQITYPSTTDIDKGNEEVRQLRSRLAARLPNHEVKVTKFLRDYQYVEEIVVETGDLEKEELKQDYVVEIQIKGPEINIQGEAAYD